MVVSNGENMGGRGPSKNVPGWGDVPRDPGAGLIYDLWKQKEG